jgi:hypothetical protein
MRHAAHNFMNQSIAELPAEVAEGFDLGLLLGQHQTLGVVAGRCSAAQAAGLRRLRDEGKFKTFTPRWRDFCSQYLRISGAEADRLIQCWEEFGSAYFELAQLVRISPRAYRQIAPAIRDGALVVDGEAIGLNMENARRLTAAVADLRRATPKPVKKPKPPLAMPERIRELDKRCTEMIAEFREISRMEQAGVHWLKFTSVLTRMTAELRRLELENGIA